MERTWELIVKYSGSLDTLKTLNIKIVYLLNHYAILTVPESVLDIVYDVPQIEYIEQPQRLFFADSQGDGASCISVIKNGPLGLTGRGVIIGLVDSGVDYTHPDFIREDQMTRILSLWDQTAEIPREAEREDVGEFPGPPAGYYRGVLYSAAVINEALRQTSAEERKRIVPSADDSGHGTAVLGIAGGNGRQGGRAYAGVATESEFIVVKLGNPQADGFPRTTELMEGINYILTEGVRLKRPVVINVSFGNNYGNHEGTSLLETYIDDASSTGKSLIVIGTGNEGAAGGHTFGQAVTGNISDVPLSVGEFQPGMILQLWKNFADVMDIELIAPSGRSSGVFQEKLGPLAFSLDSTGILLNYGQPSPYSMSQGIYIEFVPEGSYVAPGVWTVRLHPLKIVDGTYQMWLPGAALLNTGTRFLYPSPELTLTIPSTASRALSVGAYDPGITAMADFSGRGNTSRCAPVAGCLLKPDLVAPGVNITTTAAGGGYTYVTGTSFATPFVTGSAALLMEWGIIRENSPYLYGDFLKAALLAGAKPMPGYDRYPNGVTGYGRLCLADSLSRLQS
ncbi:S8 family peptidase [Catenibacillus scindens]|uniref:S8 family peptidase n=1 Tax=Catenibacillus scindens TaxID=673271 RepID=UPI00320B303E